MLGNLRMRGSVAAAALRCLSKIHTVFMVSGRGFRALFDKCEHYFRDFARMISC